MTWHLDDYRCTLLCGILRCNFQETSPRNTAENTAKHRGGGVGSVVANHRGGGETSIICNNTNADDIALLLSSAKDAAASVSGHVARLSKQRYTCKQGPSSLCQHVT